MRYWQVTAYFLGNCLKIGFRYIRKRNVLCPYQVFEDNIIFINIVYRLNIIYTIHRTLIFVLPYYCLVDVLVACGILKSAANIWPAVSWVPMMNKYNTHTRNITRGNEICNRIGAPPLTALSLKQ